MVNLDRIIAMVKEVTPQRPSPEQLLAQIEREERRERRGRLKVFLGYAGGVGKSFQMLDEGRRRRERGEDVIVCALQPDYPPEVQAILKQLEIIPTVHVGDAESIDVPAVIRRHPQLALIDGLAYDQSLVGSQNAHRWQDVEQLLDAGISVATTVNIQYLEKLQGEIRAPDRKKPAFFHHSTRSSWITSAVMTSSLWMLRRQKAFAWGQTLAKSAAALAERHKLSRLRELALLVAASVVDGQLGKLPALPLAWSSRWECRNESWFV